MDGDSMNKINVWSVRTDKGIVKRSISLSEALLLADFLTANKHKEVVVFKDQLSFGLDNE
jgi:hypothetical protein